MRIQWIVRLLALAAAATVPVAVADTLLISRIQPPDPDAKARAAYLWVGANALRYDDGRQALIADFAAGTVSVLDHADKTVRQQTLGRPPTALPVVDVVPGTTQVRRWPAREHVLRWPEYGITSRVFTSQIAGLDDQLFRKAVRKLAGVPGAGWLAALADLPGFPVRIESTVETDQGSVTTARDTINVMTRDAPVATYRVPAGYTAADD